VDGEAAIEGEAGGVEPRLLGVPDKDSVSRSNIPARCLAMAMFCDVGVLPGVLDWRSMILRASEDTSGNCPAFPEFDFRSCFKPWSGGEPPATSSQILLKIPAIFTHSSDHLRANIHELSSEGIDNAISRHREW
jgi:hypothetical protein